MVSTLWIQKPRPILVQSWVSCPHPVGARKDTWAPLTVYMRSRAHSPSRFPPHKENVFSASKNQWPQCRHPADSRGPENTQQITKLHGSSRSNILNYISKPFFFNWGRQHVCSVLCNLLWIPSEKLFLWFWFTAVWVTLVPFVKVCVRSQITSFKMRSIPCIKRQLI